MRVVVLGINYWPEEAGIADFTTRRCEFLASRGHNVTIITGFPYYPKWQIEESYRGRLWMRETRNGVTILRSMLYVPRRVTATRRVLHEASFVVSAISRALGAERPDVLFAVSPPLALSLAAQALSRAWRVPYIFHVEDLQPDAAVDLGMLPAGRIVRLLYALEHRAYRRANLVTTLTPAMRQKIVAKGIDAAKVRVLPQWMDRDLARVRTEQERAQLRSRFGFEGKRVVLYGGNMGVKQGLGVVLEAAAHSRSDDLQYVLVGDGAVRQQLEAQGRSMNLRNVEFRPIQPKAEFVDMLAAADLSLVTQQKTVADVVFPSKVVTLFASGSPVVASVTRASEVARVVSEAGAGVVVPPEDAEALHSAVRDLLADEAARRRMAERGRQYALGCWDPAEVLPQMERALRDLVFEGEMETEYVPGARWR